MKIAAFVATMIPLTSAHFGLTFPAWRADSLAETNESISQWTYPCANVQTMQNASQERTPWPLAGGSILLELHHHWTYLFVNLGFGSEVTNFNISLNPDGGKLLNETGNGTFCWNQLPIPSAEILGLDITEGMEGSIQVVTVGDSGSALYNCADIVFTSNATLLPSDQCMNSTGVTAASLQGSANATESSNEQSDRSATSSGSTASSSSTGGAVSMAAPAVLVVLAAGLMAL